MKNRMSRLGDAKYFQSTKDITAPRKTSQQQQGGLYFAVIQSPTTSRTMADSGEEEDQRCDVKKVASAFRMREDGALALQLQEHEFRHHYSRNKEDRTTARVDVRAAKATYLKEVTDAGLLSPTQVQELGLDDDWMSNEIEARIREQEQLDEQRRKCIAMQDEEYAQYLQMKEKEKIELARHKRLEKRIERDRGKGDGAILSVEASKPPSTFVYQEPGADVLNGEVEYLAAPPRATPPKVHNKPRRNAAPTSNGRERSIDDEIVEEIEKEEKIRTNLEKQDEEFARLVQEEEMVRQQRMVEDRDRRLALKLQRIETSEFKRKRNENEARQALAMPESKPPHPEYDNERKQIESDRRSLNSSGSRSSHPSYDSSLSREPSTSSRDTRSSQHDVMGAASTGRQEIKSVKGDQKKERDEHNKPSGYDRAYSVAGSGNKKDYDMAKRERDGYKASVEASNNDRKTQSMKTRLPSNDPRYDITVNGSSSRNTVNDVPEPDYPGAKKTQPTNLPGFTNIAETIDPTYKRSSTKGKSMGKR